MKTLKTIAAAPFSVLIFLGMAIAGIGYGFIESARGANFVARAARGAHITAKDELFKGF